MLQSERHALIIVMIRLLSCSLYYYVYMLQHRNTYLWADIWVKVCVYGFEFDISLSTYQKSGYTDVLNRVNAI